jgi:hypothetical protein
MAMEGSLSSGCAHMNAVQHIVYSGGGFEDTFAAGDHIAFTAALPSRFLPTTMYFAFDSFALHPNSLIKTNMADHYSR